MWFLPWWTCIEFHYILPGPVPWLLHVIIFPKLVGCNFIQGRECVLLILTPSRMFFTAQMLGKQDLNEECNWCTQGDSLRALVPAVYEWHAYFYSAHATPLTWGLKKQKSYILENLQEEGKVSVVSRVLNFRQEYQFHCKEITEEWITHRTKEPSMSNSHHHTTQLTLCF